jgi:hypothetical protein
MPERYPAVAGVKRRSRAPAADSATGVSVDTLAAMGGMSRRPNRSPRRARERRAYQLTVVGGTAALVTAVGVVLAILGIISGSVPVFAAIVAAICWFLFRRTVST